MHVKSALLVDKKPSISAISLPCYPLRELIQEHELIAKTIVETLYLEKKEKILLAFRRYLREGYYPYFLEIEDEKLYFIALEQNLHQVKHEKVAYLACDDIEPGVQCRIPLWLFGFLK